ncbi:hypothetical protein D3C73_1043500 [compost metagenome]
MNKGFLLIVIGCGYRIAINQTLILQLDQALRKCIHSSLWLTKLKLAAVVINKGFLGLHNAQLLFDRPVRYKLNQLT